MGITSLEDARKYLDSNHQCATSHLIAFFDLNDRAISFKEGDGVEKLKEYVLDKKLKCGIRVKVRNDRYFVFDFKDAFVGQPFVLESQLDLLDDSKREKIIEKTNVIQNYRIEFLHVIPQDIIVEIVSYFPRDVRKSFVCTSTQALAIISEADQRRHFRSKELWHGLKTLSKREVTENDKTYFVDNSYLMFHMNSHWPESGFSDLYKADVVHKKQQDRKVELDDLPDFFCHSLDYLDCLFELKRTWPLSPRFLRALYDRAVEDHRKDQINQWIIEKISPFSNASSAAFGLKGKVMDVKVSLFISNALGGDIIPLMHKALKIERSDQWLGIQFYRFLLEKAALYDQGQLQECVLFNNEYRLKNYVMNLPPRKFLFVKAVLNSIKEFCVDEDSEPVRNSVAVLELIEARVAHST